MLVGVSCGLLASACTRYEYKQPQCPPEDLGDTTLVVSLQRGASQDASIEGRVVDSQSRDALEGSHVRLAMRLDTLAMLTDSAGLFVFRGTRDGPATILVTHIGYHTRSVELELIDSQTVRVTVPLPPFPLDGCPGFAVIRVRRPWWKFW